MQKENPRAGWLSGGQSLGKTRSLETPTMAITSQLLRIARDVEPSATDGDLLRRYVQNQDEAAFAEVVRHNGPLVLRACRSVLGEATAAEDAFQATFLVLARRASRLT